MSFWGRIHDAGWLRPNEWIVGEILVDGEVVSEATVTLNNRNGEDAHIQVLGAPWVGDITTLQVRFTLTANVDNNNPQQPEWGVLSVDDVVLELDPVRGISPSHVVLSGGDDDTFATVLGSNLSGTPTVTLEQGATVLTGAGVVVAGDGNSLTATFPTDGAPVGLYDVVIDTGSEVHTLPSGFAIRGAGASLLVNGDFNAGPVGQVPTGWTEWEADWDGISDVSAYNSVSIHNPSPLVYEGAYGLRHQEGGTGDGGCVQTVQVVPGEVLELDWQWAGGDSAAVGDALHQTGIYSGSFVSVHNFLPNIDFEVKPGQSGDFGWEAGSITFPVPADTYSITISCRTWHQTPTTIATYWDVMTLKPGGCANQHTLISALPDQAMFPDTINLTVEGTNLAQVTGIRLYLGGVSHSADPGTISVGGGAGGTQLSATFTPPTGGWPIGVYDIKTDQIGCATATLPAAIDIGCGPPITLGAVSPLQVTKPAGLTTFTITGENIDLLDTIQLVHTPEPGRADGLPIEWIEALVPIPVLDAEDVVVIDPDTLQANFQLFGAPPGTYTLRGLRDNSEDCTEPDDVEAVFELLLPPDGQNLLSNTTFETGSIDPWVLTPADGFIDKPTEPPTPIPGPELAFSSLENPYGRPDDPDPGQDWTWYAHDGYYFVSTLAIANHFTDWVSPNGGTMEQTLPGLPADAGDYNLTLVFWVRLWNSPNPDLADFTASIVIDGEVPPESSLTVDLVDLANAESPSPEWNDGYVRLAVDYAGPVQSSIGVRFETFSGAGDPAWGPPIGIITFDDVELITTVPFCPNPFADADIDGDVDHDDFGVLQACITDSDFAGELPSECRCLDWDDDGAIYQPDIAAFEDCATAPDLKHADYPNPNCSDQP